MIPNKPAPDLIRGGNRFSEKIMLYRALTYFLARFVGAFEQRQHDIEIGDDASDARRD